MITDKIRPHHLERKAILYVSQSSTHQVLHNRESSALQYAMRDRLWLSARMDVFRRLQEFGGRGLPSCDAVLQSDPRLAGHSVNRVAPDERPGHPQQGGGADAA